MTIWTDQTSTSETWANANEETRRVFSPSVFSHASFGGHYIFSMNPRSGIWDGKSSTVETWTAIP
jgi:hypothetical protein